MSLILGQMQSLTMELAALEHLKIDAYCCDHSSVFVFDWISFLQVMIFFGYVPVNSDGHVMMVSSPNHMHFFPGQAWLSSDPVPRTITFACN